MKKADVALCCYNDANSLIKAIESVLQQKFLGIFFIVDDGSVDHTPAILQKFQENPQIEVITNEKNEGLASSLNKIISKSKADYIARIDADDEMLSNRLQLQVEYLENNKEVSVLGSNAKFVDNSKTLFSSLPLNYAEVSDALRRYNCLLHPTVMFRRKTVKFVQGYDVTFRRCQDYELWLKLCRHSFKLENLNQVTTIINVRKNRSWRSITDEFFALIKIALRYKKIPILFYSIYSLTYNIKTKII